MCAVGEGFRGRGIPSKVTDELAWISATTYSCSACLGIFCTNCLSRKIHLDSFEKWGIGVSGVRTGREKGKERNLSCLTLMKQPKVRSEDKQRLQFSF